MPIQRIIHYSPRTPIETDVVYRISKACSLLRDFKSAAQAYLVSPISKLLLILRHVGECLCPELKIYTAATNCFKRTAQLQRTAATNCQMFCPELPNATNYNAFVVPSSQLLQIQMLFAPTSKMLQIVLYFIPS